MQIQHGDVGEAECKKGQRQCDLGGWWTTTLATRELPRWQQKSGQCQILKLTQPEVAGCKGRVEDGGGRWSKAKMSRTILPHLLQVPPQRVQRDRCGIPAQIVPLDRERHGAEFSQGSENDHTVTGYKSSDTTSESDRFTDR